MTAFKDNIKTRPENEAVKSASTLTRDIDIANMSVCPSVRYVPVLYENG